MFVWSHRTLFAGASSCARPGSGIIVQQTKDWTQIQINWPRFRSAGQWRRRRWWPLFMHCSWPKKLFFVFILKIYTVKLFFPAPFFLSLSPDPLIHQFVRYCCCFYEKHCGCVCKLVNWIMELIYITIQCITIRRICAGCSVCSGMCVCDGDVVSC